MARYKIYAGLGGGFGGDCYDHTDEFETEALAEEDAYETACGVYESYEGSNGLMSFEEVLKEAKDEISEEDYEDEESCGRALEEIADEILNEQRESWIKYHVELETEENKEED